MPIIERDGLRVHYRRVGEGPVVVLVQGVGVVGDGHSMGGLIAQQVALTATARIISLALLCTFLKGRQGR